MNQKKQSIATWSIASLFIAVIVGAYMLNGYLQQQSPGPSEAAVDVSGVRIEMSVSDHAVAPGSRIDVTVDLENNTSEALLAPRVDFLSAPGFRVVGRRNQFGTHLNAGASQRLIYTLQSTRAHGQFRVRLQFSWTRGSQRSMASVASQAISVGGEWMRYVWLPATVQSIAKDLALPIVVALLAAYLKKIEDERKKTAEDKEFTQARLHETYTLMLPKHHKNVEQHYLPVLSSIREIHRYYVTEPDLQKLLFFLLQMFRNLQKLRSAIGGLYFKTREGEEVAREAILIVVPAADSWFGRENRDRAVEMFQAKSYGEFDKRLAGDAHLKASFDEILKLLQRWHAAPPRNPPLVTGDRPDRFNVSEVMQVLIAFSEIVRFECNRPYEYWYGNKVQVPRKAFVSFVEQPVFRDERLMELRKLLRRYFDALHSEYEPTDQRFEKIVWLEP